ncbi:MAG: RNA polymerase sigma factor [Gemmatimonadaceae bacterium]
MPDAGRLFDEHHQSLYRYLVRFSGDADLAADAVQEAFLRLVERPPPDVGGARAWLFKVATNVVLESARTRSRRLRLLAASPARAPVGDAPRSPADLVESDEQRRLVGEALASLSDKERTALLMREEGFSHREIAEAVGTTTGSVGTLVARALARLADELALDRDDV